MIANTFWVTGVQKVNGLDDTTCNFGPRLPQKLPRQIIFFQVHLQTALLLVLVEQHKDFMPPAVAEQPDNIGVSELRQNSDLGFSYFLQALTTFLVLAIHTLCGKQRCATLASVHTLVNFTESTPPQELVFGPVLCTACHVLEINLFNIIADQPASRRPSLETGRERICNLYCFLASLAYS